MLSGEYTSVPLSSITWQRSGRIRKKITEEAILEKMESMSRLGLIHPLTVTREGFGIAGETRWNAAVRLGWDSIDIQWSDTLEEDDLLAIELEENVKRTDLEWQDQCDALLRLHNLKLAKNPEWTQDQTAEAIGLKQETVSAQLAVARELKAGNPRVVNAERYSIARGITVRQTERRKADELSALKIEVLPDGKREDNPQPEPAASPIQHADFLKWLPTFRGPPFNLIHCDFPYGIGADQFNQGAAGSFGGYEDSEETYWSLVNALVDNRERLLGSSGHIIFWFSMRYYQTTLDLLSQVFWVDPYPLLWHKSDNKGTLPDPTRGPRRVYEVAFLCSHGDRKIIQSVSNVFSGPTLRSGEHMSEKSEDMLAHFFRMVVDSNTRLLDPTCGSGSALRAARRLGATDLVGLELNEEFAENARRAFDNGK